MLSDEQAEPEWTATPARSSPMSTGSASTPSTPRQTRWGSLPSGAPGPTTATPSTASAASTTDADAVGAPRPPPSPSAGLRRPPAPPAAAPKASERRQRLEPGAAPALLLAADQEGLEPAAAPHDQRAGTGHPAELVRADADQVGVERGQVGRARARRPRRRPRGR